MKTSAPVSGLLPDEINTTCSISPSFRGKQIFSALWKGETSFENMTVLPKALRRQLSENHLLMETVLSDSRLDTEGTKKIVLKCNDGYLVEAVMLTDGKGRNTACISTQAGCGMGCAFCKTGTLGLSRNLSPTEITEQFLHLQNSFGKISNIVFMGMGEPLLNLDALRRSVTLFTHPEGAALSIRRMTVSTCGIIQGLRSLASEGPHLRLAVSLITAIQNKRELLMPSAKGHPLRELRFVLSDYQARTGKRITFEYVLLPGENDTDADIGALKDFVQGFSYIVNLIPWNYVEGLPFRKPRQDEIQSFENRLRERKINFTRRFGRGGKIDGACGQLGGYQEK